jgi:two-component system, cell cycle sensor histidine kinase and response regulator CckA
MQSFVNPQELLEMALGVSLVLLVLVLALLVAYLRHRAARGRAERAMDRAQAYIGAVLDAAIPGIVVIDDEGVVDAFNLAAERMFGYGAFEIIGRKIGGFKLFAAPVGKESENGDPFSTAFISTAGSGGVGVQALGRRKNGSTFPAELFVSEGHVGRRRVLVGVVQDITARKLAEEGIRDGLARAEDVLDSIGAMVVILDAAGKVLRINHACEQATGYGRGEVAGSFFWDVFPAPGDSADARENLEQARHRGVARKGESDWLTKDRRVRRVAWRLTWMATGEGPARQFVIAGIDVTDQAQHSEQAAGARVTAALESFADAVAMRLTDALTAASGYAELALAGLAMDNVARNDVVEMQQASAKAVELARDLQAFGRGQILMPRLVDVNTMLSGMEGHLRRMLGDGIKLELMLAPAIGRVRIDPEGLARAIERLAIFAADRLAGAGRIVLRTLEAQGGPSAAYVMLAVLVPDLEMPAESCARVFQPFAAEPTAADDTGLGLAAVFGFLRQSGADAHAVSRPGNGTRLEIYLPRVELAAQPQSANIYTAAEE